MTLLSDVVAVLERAGIDHALIGAAAMALHGVSRATADIDLFTVDDNSLRRALWDGERSGGEGHQRNLVFPVAAINGRTAQRSTEPWILEPGVELLGTA